MTSLTAEPSAPVAKYIKISGTVLLALGLLMPAGAWIVGWLPTSQLLLQTWRALYVLAGLAGMAWCLTKWSGIQAKAWARLIIGVLACGVVFFSVSESVRLEDSVSFLTRQLTVVKERAFANDASLTKRFTTLPMDTVLTAENLVSPEGRLSGRETVTQFRALIAERDALRKKFALDIRNTIAAVPSQEIRDSALAGIDAKRDNTARSAEDLDRAQYQLADAHSAIIDWCERQGNSLSVKEHQLLLSDASQEPQLEALLESLRKAQQREDDMVRRVEDIGRKALSDWAALMKERYPAR